MPHCKLLYLYSEGYTRLAVGEGFVKYLPEIRENLTKSQNRTSNQKEKEDPILDTNVQSTIMKDIEELFARQGESKQVGKV